MGYTKAIFHIQNFSEVESPDMSGILQFWRSQDVSDTELFYGYIVFTYNFIYRRHVFRK